MWVVCNAHFACTFESKTRGYAAIEKIAETLEGPAVSDCWTAYEKLEQEQQKCLGHLASSVNEVLVAKQKENARIAKVTAKAEAARVVAEALPEGERRRRSEGGLARPTTVPRRARKTCRSSGRKSHDP